MRHERLVALFVCLAAGLSGCLKKETVQSNITFKPEANKVVIEQPKLDPNAKVEKAPELPEKLPQPATCIMAAECLEQAAVNMESESARKQNYAKAQFEYQRALQTDPKCIPALVGVARCHDKLGNHEEAIKGYQQVLTLAPNAAEVWFETGMSYNKHEQLPQALECLRKASSLEPNNSGYSNHLIMTLAKAGQFDESLTYLRKRLPEDRACYSVAKMANHFGRRDLCGHYLHAALQANPNLTEAQQMLAVLQAAASGAN